MNSLLCFHGHVCDILLLFFLKSYSSNIFQLVMGTHYNVMLYAYFLACFSANNITLSQNLGSLKSPIFSW
jgi:hypothetical protein